MVTYCTKKRAKVIIFFDICKFICKFVVIFGIWKYIEEKERLSPHGKQPFIKDIR